MSKRSLRASLMLIVGWWTTANTPAALAVEPPAMPHREIQKPATPPAGRQIDIVDGDCKALLFVPDGYALPTDGNIDLAVHFHGGTWFAIDEHLRRGLNGPLLAFQLGEGSSTYARPFRDVGRFGRMLALVEQALADNAHEPRVTQIDITSFSAGYGAVREIVQNDAYLGLIRRVILCDSFYAGWDPATTQPGGPASRPADENVRPFARLAELAAKGEKTLVITHSSVPTPYANTQATADWVVSHVGGTWADVPASSSPAASDSRFALYRRADVGRLHVWGYRGEDAQAHMTHARHLADVWRALDAANE